MARLRRLYIPGYPLHLVVRGNDRQDIFRSEGDRVFFHRCLVETTRAHGVHVHAYVLMTNHVHLLATGDKENSFSKTIQSMGRRYVSYFNYLHQRTGTLWEGRFHSSLVQSDRYLFACHRYIETNPVRAGMVRHAADHSWSSYGANACGRGDDLVTPHALYLCLGSVDANRRRAYEHLFEGAVCQSEVEEIRSALNKGWPLGDDAFRGQLELRSGRRTGPLRRGRKPGARRIIAASPN